MIVHVKGRHSASIRNFIAIASLITVLLLSTALYSHVTQKESANTITSLNEFYLKELTNRRSQVIVQILHDRAEQMKLTMSVISDENLQDETSLQNFLGMMKKANGLDMFAVVDDYGMVYTESSIFSGISRFSFLSEEMTEPVTSVYDTFGGKMVIIALPVEAAQLGERTIKTCFCGIMMDTILDSFALDSEENKTYCYLFTRYAELLSKGSNARHQQKDPMIKMLENDSPAERSMRFPKLKDDWTHLREGFFSYQKQDKRISMYYQPVPSSDWYLVLAIENSVIDKNIANIHHSIVWASYIQLVALLAFSLFVLLNLQRSHKEKQKMEIEQRNTEEKLKIQAKLLAEEQARNRYSELFESLSGNYRSVIYVEAEKDIALIYRASKEAQELMSVQSGTRTSYMQLIQEYIEKTVAEQDRRKLALLCDINWLKSQFIESAQFSQTYLSTLDGNYYMELRAALISCEKEDFRFVIAFADVDKQVKNDLLQKQNLMDALAQAEHANKAKTVFLNNMSHDIRTPMNAIIGFTSLAATHLHKTDQVKDYLGKIMTSSNHLLSLINDVLDMSRIESDKVKIEATDCSLAQIMHDLRNILQSDIKSKQMDFFIDTIDIMDEDVICDKLRLNQVLLNTVSNAIKYTKPGGTISLRVKQLPGSKEGFGDYEFTVRDTGIGMKKEFLEHIFEPFTREQNSTVSGIQGTGLGMSITKNIIDMMGGSISIASEVGNGTTVTIRLSLRLSSNPHRITVIRELEGVRALVTDDDMDTCIGVVRMLRTIGMRPEWTSSGREAVVRTKAAVEDNDPYQAFIIDWLMPDMNGIEVVRRIRSSIGDDTPIIILTAYDWSDIEEEARAAGVTGFCEKPIFLSDLYDVLRSQVSEKNGQTVQKNPEKAVISGRRILLVEDNDMNREIATAVLDEYHITVDEAENGLAGVEKFRVSEAGYYDAILMDIQMPVMDGYEATKMIRLLDKADATTVPIIAMTANAFEEDKKEVFEAGMNDYLAKPFKTDNLYVLLQRYLKD